MSWSACSLVSSLLLYASPMLMTQPQLAAEHGDDLLHLSDESVGIRVSNADAALGLDRADEGLEGVDGGDIVVLVHIVDGLHGRIQLGIQAVLDSLWEVDDRSTTELMKTFYRYLPKMGKARRALVAGPPSMLKGRWKRPRSSPPKLPRSLTTLNKQA